MKKAMMMLLVVILGSVAVACGEDETDTQPDGSVGDAGPDAAVQE